MQCLITISMRCTLILVLAQTEACDFAGDLAHLNRHSHDYPRPRQRVVGPMQADEMLLLFGLIRASSVARVLEVGGFKGDSAYTFLRALRCKFNGPVKPMVITVAFYSYGSSTSSTSTASSSAAASSSVATTAAVAEVERQLLRAYAPLIAGMRLLPPAVRAQETCRPPFPLSFVALLACNLSPLPPEGPRSIDRASTFLRTG